MHNPIFFSAKWEFNEFIAEIFDMHIRQSTPFYDEIQRMILELANSFITDNAIICDLGAATGETVYNLNTKYSSRNPTFYAIDNSLPMLRKAEIKCKNIRNVIFINEDMNNFTFPRSNLIISLYTLQFTNEDNRQDIINKIYDSLQINSAFILCEKITFDNEFISDYYIKFHEDLKRRNHINDEEIIAKKISLINVMNPITYKENYYMLKKSGFSIIQTFFQWYNFVGIIAIKN